MARPDAARRPPAGYAPVLARETLQARVAELGAELARALKPRERPVAVVVLQGAFVFAADLLRHVPHSTGLEVAFLRCESYGAATRSRGRVLLLQDLDQALDLHGRTVVLVDDILDSGLTLKYLVRHLKARGAARVKVCVLLKRKAGGARAVRADYVGFEIGPEFVAGYGMDHAGKFRHVPDLWAVKPARRRGARARR
ncbi:MAG: phosphoribosyltransferase family protein [Planctomycetota bacterium]|nr:phosphoribosyltransferase family protein [Planctomycetota bacterium]